MTPGRQRSEGHEFTIERRPSHQCADDGFLIASGVVGESDPGPPFIIDLDIDEISKSATADVATITTDVEVVIRVIDDHSGDQWMVDESIGQNRHVAAPATIPVFRTSRVVITHLAIVDLADISNDHAPFIASKNRRKTALQNARRGNHHRLTPSLTLVTREGVPWHVICRNPSRVHIPTFIHRNPMIHLAALCVLLGFNAFFFGLLAEVLIRMNFAIQKKEPYRVRQIRGLEQRTPHIGASQTPPDPEPESAPPKVSQNEPESPPESDPKMTPPAHQ